MSVDLIKWYYINQFSTGYRGVVTLKNEHNHACDTAYSMRFLPASDETKAAFQVYFAAGMTAAAALRHHRELVEVSSENPELRLANASVTPTSRQVYYWYSAYRLSTIGDNSCAKTKEVGWMGKGI